MKITSEQIRSTVERAQPKSLGFYYRLRRSAIEGGFERAVDAWNILIYMASVN